MNNLTEKAKDIIQNILYITIATSSTDGQPWNTPVYAAYDDEFNFYWASDKNGKHSKNIAENNKIFIVIYDSNAPLGTGEGVYILAKAHSLSQEDEIKKGLELLDTRAGNAPVSKPNEFLEVYPRRIYKAIPEKIWLNGDGEVDGNYIDIRMAVDLLHK